MGMGDVGNIIKYLLGQSRDKIRWYTQIFLVVICSKVLH